MEIGLRNLHVVTKNLVEANLQRSNAGAFALAFFHRGNNLFAVLAEVAKLVEFPIVPVPDDAGVGGESWRLVGDCPLQTLAYIGEFINLAVQVPEQRAATHRRRRQKILQHGKLDKRFAQRDKFARRSQPKSDAAREPFEILDAPQLFANLPANHGLLQEVGDGFEARFDGVAIQKGPENPRAQKTRAHTRDGRIKSGDESHGPASGSLLGKDWGEEFQIADGDRIEDERLVLLIVAHALQVLQRRDAGWLRARRIHARVRPASGVFP